MIGHISCQIDCMCEQCFNAYDRLGKIKKEATNET